MLFVLFIATLALSVAHFWQLTLPLCLIGMYELSKEIQSFSHKRENIEAMAETKKTETGQRRIESMIKNLLKMREAKELKATANKK